MTLSSTTVKEQYSGDGSTVEFAIPFAFWDSSEVRVILTDTAGEETVWTEGTEYTVTGGDGATGEITVDTDPTDYTPAAGQRLTIKSNLPDTQATDLVVGGAFNTTTVEERLDKTVRQIQQLAEEVGRAPKLTEGTTSTTPTLPEPSDGELIGWSGAALANMALAALDLSFDTVFTDLTSGDFLKWDGANWINQAPNIAAVGVRVVAESNVAISTGLAAGQAIDDVTLVAGDLVLLTNQSTSAENGIYVASSSGAASRDDNFDTYDSLCGVLVVVQEGTSNADTLWVGESDKGGSLGSTAISFQQFTGATVFTALEISDTSADHQYVFAVNELAADRTITLPLLTGDDTFVFEDHEQTLTGKTVDLTDNTLSGTKAEFDAALSDENFAYAGVLASTSNGEGASLIGIEDSAGDFTATDVEGALAELQSEKQPLDATLTAFAGVTFAANKAPYATAADTFATYDLTAFGRTLAGYADEASFKAGVNLEANTDYYAPGGTDVPVTDGGTGASTEAGARGNLGLEYATEFIRKTADETVNNSNTLQDDDELLAALAANETIVFECMVIHVGTNTADFKMAFTVPTGATISWSFPNNRLNDAGTASGGFVQSTGSLSVNAATSNQMQLAIGVVRNGANAGNLQLQWAQNTAEVVDTIVRADSYLLVRRID